MRKELAGLVIAAVILALVVPAGSIWAADANKPKEPNTPPKNVAITVKGKVVVTKDAKSNITSVKLMGNKDVTYEVTLDAKGKELASTMAHKMVEITGILSVKDGTKWLTAEKYTEVQKPEPKSPKKSKKNKPQG